jgi:glycosyltransferase involved in cell wall biosynthesis
VSVTNKKALGTSTVGAPLVADSPGSEQHVPLVSIGLAVYNGENYLREAIDSILAQTFSDFELIISDNASTDSTAEICQEYACLDNRIRYHRNATNIGGANNENQTFRMSRGKYFRWAAHDDVLAPALLERCVEVMEGDPGVVLCYTAINVIDAEGTRMGNIFRNHGASSHAVARFRAIVTAKDYCEETYGLMRSEVLRRTRLQLDYTGSDRTLMSELTLYGRFHAIPEYLFFKRMHAANEYLDWRTRMAWFNPSFRGRIFFPFWAQFRDYFATIRRSKLPLSVQLRCAGIIAGPWFFVHAKNMAKDVAVAAYMRLQSEEWRKKRYADSDNWS